MTTKPSEASLKTLRILMISDSRDVRYPDWLIIFDHTSLFLETSRFYSAPFLATSFSALACGRLCRTRHRFPSRTCCPPAPPSFSRRYAISAGPPSTHVPSPSPQTPPRAQQACHQSGSERHAGQPPTLSSLECSILRPS